MPVFPKPTVSYRYTVATELQRLRAHKAKRSIPAKTADTLLIGTWNIANLGAQARRASDHQLIAEILGWFDVAAVQECRDNFSDLYDIQHYLGKPYQIVMSDASGNNERMVFIYDAAKVTRLDEIGEVADANFGSPRSGAISSRWCPAWRRESGS